MRPTRPRKELKTMENEMKELYEKKLCYNCSFATMKHNNNDLLIVYLGTSDFLIVSNYIGVVAVGSYRFDYDTNEAFIKYEIKHDHYNISTIERLIYKYERQIMGLKCKINITRKTEE